MKAGRYQGKVQLRDGQQKGIPGKIISPTEGEAAESPSRIASTNEQLAGSKYAVKENSGGIR